MSASPPPELTTADYPLSINRPELLHTPSGKPITALTMDAVVSGELTAEDLRIAPETLQLQAQLADASNRPQLAANFRRAAEMTAIPDDEVLAMYNAAPPPRVHRGAARPAGRPPGGDLRGAGLRGARPGGRRGLRAPRPARPPDGRRRLTRHPGPRGTSRP